MQRPKHDPVRQAAIDKIVDKAREFASAKPNIVVQNSNGVNADASRAFGEMLYFILSTIDQLIYAYLNKYGNDSIKDLAEVANIGRNNNVEYGTTNGEPVTGDLLIHAILVNKPALVKSLVDLGMNQYSRTKCKSPAGNNSNPLIFACEIGRAEMIEMLLATNSHDCVRTGDDGQNIFSKALSSNAYKIFREHFKKMLESNLIKTEYAAFQLLASLRISYLQLENAPLETYQVIDEICGYLKRMLTFIDKYKPVQFNVNDASIKYIDHAACHQALFKTDLTQDMGADKGAVLRRANSKVLMLFTNPERCIPYLRHLNDEFARFCREYKRDPFSANKVKSDTYTWFDIYSLTVPVPNSNYSTPKKYSRLQEFLLHLFQQHGMGDEVIKWVGFIPSDIANQQVGSGNLVIENVFGGASLFHGALSHMIQTVMMLYAYQHGDIELPGCSIKELIFSQVSTPVAGDNSKNIWIPMRDSIDYRRAYFYDPYRLNEFIMQDKNQDMPELAAFMRDSFMGQLTRYSEKMLALKPHLKSVDNMLAKLSDLDPRMFYDNKSLVAHAEYRLWVSRHIVTSGSFSGNSYAYAKRRAYDTYIDFEHTLFTKVQSSYYVVTVDLGAEPGYAVYIGSADEKMGRWDTAYRMYYDAEQKLWAFNLPKGVVLNDFRFLVGPIEPVGAESTSRGTFVKVSKETWNGNTLEISNDDSKELFYHLSRNDFSSFTNCINQLAATKSNEELQSIICKPEQGTGNTLLHVAISAESINLPVLNLLLQHGANVLASNKNGLSAFAISLSFLNLTISDLGRFDNIINTFASACANISEAEADELVGNSLTTIGCVRLAFLAIDFDNLNLLRATFKHGVDLQSVSADGNSFLHLAAMKNKVELMKDLIRYGASFDNTNKLNLTPLAEAAMKNNLEAFKYLLEIGANVHHQITQDYNILKIACNKGKADSNTKCNTMNK
jgi:ankyrin repeat protein